MMTFLKKTRADFSNGDMFKVIFLLSCVYILTPYTGQSAQAGSTLVNLIVIRETPPVQHSPVNILVTSWDQLTLG